jgi:hypothetical protein
MDIMDIMDMFIIIWNDVSLAYNDDISSVAVSSKEVRAVCALFLLIFRKFNMLYFYVVVAIEKMEKACVVVVTAVTSSE